MPQPLDFYDESALLDRLSKGLKRRSQPTVFLVGAPMSAPAFLGAPGVPGVDGVLDLIRGEFADDPAQLSALNKKLESEKERRYQAAFQFLQGRRGQQTANEIVRKAVRSARSIGDGILDGSPVYSDDECSQMELDTHGWVLGPGTEHLAKLATRYPERFGKSILTTNFDPLIEVAIRKHGGTFFKTTLHSDGDLTQTDGDGCHVIHLHGYWWGSDTLHTSRQLGQPRPRLRASLSSLLRNKLVVVCAYGGWDDAFTEALMDVVRDDAAHPEVLWTFFAGNPVLNEELQNRLSAGINRGRVTLYSGIDCNQIFSKLYESWVTLETGVPPRITPRSNPVRVKETLREKLESPSPGPTIIEGDDEDRPPVVEVWVGREPEVKKLRESDRTIAFITGVGGQGKSALAARYFDACQAEGAFSFYVWRDCKEEGERFENQLASVVEKLSRGKISGEDLAKQSASAVVEILFDFIQDSRVLFVFDNVDHYVDLETGRLAGCPHIFVEALIKSPSKARAIFTCRPSIFFQNSRVLNLPLSGIDLNSTLKLFSERGATSGPHEIEDAHKLTVGHAFWLDLLAIQVAKPSSPTDLPTLVAEIRAGKGLLPENTLSSIWSTLKERERTVLRAMAETLKPETEAEIGEYLRREVNYHKVIRALTALRGLNLVVVKRRAKAKDVLELHPMVRQFVWQRFTPRERFSFINAIIAVYTRHIGSHKSQLTLRPSLSILQYWTQNAELDINAGKIEEAFLALSDVAEAFLSSAYPREFSRAARLLLSATDWVKEHHRFKNFESVFRTQVRLLAYLGEYSEVDDLLAKYEATVPHKDARYINFCEMRCFFEWVREDFTAAVKWGRMGQSLKLSGVDTQYDVSHSLALAERDAGLPDSALPVFLAGRSLAEVVDPDELEEQRNGPHYGNVGRCLHLMGQIDTALSCYQKSALLLEKNPNQFHVINQGFIRAWIGELLVAREQFKLAEVFLRAAHHKWRNVSPPKAATVLQLSRQIKKRVADVDGIDDAKVEKICLDWIVGRNLDASFT